MPFAMDEFYPQNNEKAQYYWTFQQIIIVSIMTFFFGGGGGNRTHRPEDRPQEFLRAQAVVWVSFRGRLQPGSLGTISIDLA